MTWICEWTFGPSSGLFICNHRGFFRANRLVADFALFLGAFFTIDLGLLAGFLGVFFFEAEVRVVFAGLADVAGFFLAVDFRGVLLADFPLVEGLGFLLLADLAVRDAFVDLAEAVFLAATFF